ncbi:MAG TPA: arylsulfotransferase family protein, partial [bacterium]|nr:arylsulfotransferase family protein [bacterium]
YVLGSESNRVNWVNQKEAVVEDFVLVLDEQGEVLSRVSLLTAISSSDFDNIIKTSRMPRSGHVLGANSVQVLDGGLSGKVPSFTEGSVLVSLSGLDTIGVVDMESGSLTWTLFGMWLDQRDATLLPGGSVLLLEYPDDAPGVIEFGPVTMAVEWAYSRAPSRPLDDWWGGRVQRLPNGNTLVSESGRGTAFEVTPGGEVVWEYVNSEDGNGAAMPFEVTRIDPGFSVDRLGD